MDLPPVTRTTPPSDCEKPACAQAREHLQGLLRTLLGFQEARRFADEDQPVEDHAAQGHLQTLAIGNGWGRCNGDGSATRPNMHNVVVS